MPSLSQDGSFEVLQEEYDLHVPDSTGPLSAHLPFLTIAAINKEVEK